MCETLGKNGSLAPLRIAPPLGEWERHFFRRGLEENLFGVDERGEVESDLLPAADETGDKPQAYRIFSADPPRLLRENICQLAAAARLIFEQGWLRQHVFLEPGHPEYHANARVYDLLVRSSEGTIFIWVEARRSGVELDKLIADLRACSRRGPHAHEDCGFPQNHQRHAFCVAKQPSCLWGLAPDGEIVLGVKCDGPALELEPFSSLPPRSLFELGKI